MFFKKKKKVTNPVCQNEYPSYYNMELKKINDSIPQEVHDAVNKRIEELQKKLYQGRGYGYLPGEYSGIDQAKKELYKEYGYEWYTLKEINPTICMD